MAEQSDYYEDYGSDVNLKLRDLEEKQRILRDRLMLIGQNLIDTRENMSDKFTQVKKELEVLRQAVERMTSFLETASSEFSKFARKEDLEILKKQAKMFQPLNLVTKEDLENLKNK